MPLHGEAHGVGVELGRHLAEAIAHEAVADREVGVAVLTPEADAAAEARGEGGLLARGLCLIDVVGALGLRGVHQVEAIRGGPHDHVRRALGHAAVERGAQRAVQAIRLVHHEVVEEEDRAGTIAQREQRLLDVVELVALDLHEPHALVGEGIGARAHGG